MWEGWKWGASYISQSFWQNFHSKSDLFMYDFLEYFAIILSYFYDFVSNCISNLCSLSSTVCPLGLPLSKCSTNEPIVNLLNLLQTDYVGNQEHIFFSKRSCQKIIFLKHSPGLGDWNLAHFLTQFCVIIS